MPPELAVATPTATTPTTPTAPPTPRESVASINLNLRIGATVGTPRDCYTVLKALGNSGLTRLYLVLNGCGAKEMEVLENLREVPSEEKSHFLTLFDKGRTSIFRFAIVMQTGPTLHQIRKEMLYHDDFGEYTAAYIAFGTFQAVRDLHNLEFVHRDINLGRFAVGFDKYEKQIFMYNLGSMKRYMTDREHINRPGRQEEFTGSLLFASRNAMMGYEQSRRDDLESWLYMVFDVYDRQTFSSFFEVSKSFFKKIPRVFKNICKYINGIPWDSEPNYDHIQEILLQAQPGELRRNEYLDWIEMREDLVKNENRINKCRKLGSRADIQSSSDWTSEDSAEDDDAVAIPKDRHRLSAETSTNRNQRKKPSDNKGGSARPPSAENVEPDGRSMGRTGKGARRYKGSRMGSNGGQAPSRERIETEPSSHTGSRETIVPSKELAADTAPPTPSKESTVVMSAAESQKHAERLRRQLYINVTDTTEDDIKFTFLNDRKNSM